MAEDFIWCSARLPHPHELGVRVRFWWQEERKTEVRRTGVPSSSTVTKGADVSPGVAVKFGGPLQVRMNIAARIALQHRGFLQARSPLRPQMSVSRPRRTFSYLQAFNRSPHLTLMGRSLVSVGTAQYFSALMRPSRLTVKKMGIGVPHSARTGHASQAGAPLSFLPCTTTASRLPRFWIVRPAGLPALP